MSEDEAAQGSLSQVGTHTVPLWFARTAVTAPREEKICAAAPAVKRNLLPTEVLNILEHPSASYALCTSHMKIIN